MYIYNICALCLRGVLLGIPYLVVRWWWSRLSLSLSHSHSHSLSLTHLSFVRYGTIRYDIIRYSPADPKSRWGRHSPTLSPHETRRPASVSFFFFFSLLPLDIIIRTPEKSTLFICFLLSPVFFFFLLSIFFLVSITDFFFLFLFLFHTIVNSPLTPSNGVILPPRALASPKYRIRYRPRKS